MKNETLRAAWAEINLSNLEYNLTSIRDKVGETDVIAIVKADAYGHGAVEISKILMESGIETLGVATLHEAIHLRESGIDCNIIILGLTPYLWHSKLIEYNLIPVVSSYPNARLLSKEAVEKGKTISILIALETGMGRIGFVDSRDSMTEIEGISHLPNINIKGAFSHFATADTLDKAYARTQLHNFLDFCEKLDAKGIQIKYKTIANSAAIMEMPDSYFDAVRPGIMLYGCYPSDEMNRDAFPLKPVMSIKASIIYIKKIAKGSTVSYGAAWTAQRDSIIGTMPLGYADGLPRAISGNAEVLVHGKRVPIVGNICMDQCMVDLTDIPDIKQFDEAVIVGRQENEVILADELGQKSGTINYEIVCGFGQRLPKVYVK